MLRLAPVHLCFEHEIFFRSPISFRLCVIICFDIVFFSFLFSKFVQLICLFVLFIRVFSQIHWHEKLHAPHKWQVKGEQDDFDLFFSFHLIHCIRHAIWGRHKSATLTKFCFFSMFNLYFHVMQLCTYVYIVSYMHIGCAALINYHHQKRNETMKYVFFFLLYFIV